MFSPTWMATLANNPLNQAPFVTEEEQAELDLSGDPAAPVGVGAFVVRVLHPGQRQQLHRRPQRGLLAG